MWHLNTRGRSGGYKILISMPGAPQPVPIAITLKRDAAKVGATIPVAATKLKAKASHALLRQASAALCSCPSLHTLTV